MMSSTEDVAHIHATRLQLHPIQILRLGNVEIGLDAIATGQGHGSDQVGRDKLALGRGRVVKHFRP